MVYGLLAMLLFASTALSGCGASCVPRDCRLGTHELDCRLANLTEIPQLQVGCRSHRLTILNLSNNSITQISSKILATYRNVNYLHLTNNAISRITSDSLGFLPRLTQLYLDHNKIVYVHEAAFSNLTNLRALNLNGNFISHLPAMTFALAPRLVKVFIEENPLELGQGLCWILPPSSAFPSFDKRVVHYLENSTCHVGKRDCYSVGGHGYACMDYSPAIYTNIVVLCERWSCRRNLKSLCGQYRLKKCQCQGQAEQPYIGISPCSRNASTLSSTISAAAANRLSSTFAASGTCYEPTLITVNSSGAFCPVIIPPVFVPSCLDDMTSHLFGDLMWNTTSGNETVTQPCPLSVLALSSGTVTADSIENYSAEPLGISRHCTRLDDTTSEWAPADAQQVAECIALLEISVELLLQIDLMQLSEGELMLATSALQGLTGEADKLTPNLLTDVSTVVKGVVNVASPTEAAVADTSNTTNATKPSDTTGVAFTTLLKLSTDLVSTVGNILSVPPENVKAQTGQEFVHSLERLGSTLARSSNFSTHMDSITLHGDNIDLVATSAPVDTLSGVHFSAGNPSVESSDHESGIAIDLPREAFQQGNATDNDIGNTSATPTIYFIVYRVSTLFKDASIHPDINLSWVIASEVVGADEPVENLSAPVNVSFRIPSDMWHADLETLNASCVYWDFDKPPSGGWSEDGCILSGIDNSTSTVLCHCYHLTSFAVLLSTRVVIDQSSPAPLAQRVLSIVSYTGCTLSALCLLVTMVTIVAVRSMRRNSHFQLVFTMAVMLFLALVVFVTAIRRTSDKILCQTIAVAIHFFLLSTLSWSSADATLLYYQLVKVVGADKVKLMKKLRIAAAAVPLTIVALTCGITQMQAYGNDHFCWINNLPVLDASFVAPTGLSLIYNSVVLVAVVRSIRNSAKQKSVNSQGPRSRALRMLRSVVAMSVLFGMTWGLGIFVTFYDTLVLQYLFAIFNTLQGVFIFLHIFRDVKVRKAWMTVGTNISSRISSGVTQLRRSSTDPTSSMVFTSSSTHYRQPTGNMAVSSQSRGPPPRNTANTGNSTEKRGSQASTPSSADAKRRSYARQHIQSTNSNASESSVFPTGYSEDQRRSLGCSQSHCNWDNMPESCFSSSTFLPGHVERRSSCEPQYQTSVDE